VRRSECNRDKAGTRRFRGWRLGAILAGLLLVGVAAPAAYAGPVSTLGIDAEDGGPGGHGDTSVYSAAISNGVLANTTNGGNGMLVVGGGKVPGDDVTEFWDLVGTQTGEPITYVNGAANIGAQSFAGFQVIAVVSSEPGTSDGGLTDDENNALAARQPEISAFVNAGGGLVGFSQTGLTNPYAYLPDANQFTFNLDLSFEDIEATPDGEAVGLDDTSLDVCCWHDEYLTFPSYLRVLATNVASGNPVALGGSAVTIPENCTNGVDDDGDGLIDAADPACAPTYEEEICPFPIDGEIEVGTDGNDTIVGTDRNDLLEGRGGNDRMDGLPGRDCIFGQDGNDVANGDEDGDRIKGGKQNDRVNGNDGDDHVRGSLGNDKSRGNDGKDNVSGNGNSDNVKGNAGNDKVNGQRHRDKVFGNAGNDKVNGGPARDKLFGNAGNDRLRAADGFIDQVNCGGGDDTATVDRKDKVKKNCERVRVV
jgi:Ca2+-binding RTX toxin-like protein